MKYRILNMMLAATLITLTTTAQSTNIHLNQCSVRQKGYRWVIT